MLLVVRNPDDVKSECVEATLGLVEDANVGDLDVWLVDIEAITGLNPGTLESLLNFVVGADGHLELKAQVMDSFDCFLTGLNVPRTFVVVEEHWVSCLSVKNIHRFLVDLA